MKSLGSRLKTVGARVAKAPSKSDMRMAGKPLQARRLKLWTRCPYCVDCGRLTDYPNGFELDHEVPLEHGGPDTEANCRIRCVWFDLDGRKLGCHEAKTRRDRGGTS